MTRQAIIVFAVLLGAGLAGLMWYQLTRAPSDEVAVVSPTPAVYDSPVVSATPTPVPQQITPEPMAVSNTAPTGTSEMFLALTMGATLAGALGLRRSF